ncbi:MAG: hypothetical protein HC866_16570 [Leptolyngbyaceae cyanobacterium RU_5_1]|nr:hypothetical protein [Leptolyngbyaceae cyanobacterium RU_5_1]
MITSLRKWGGQFADAPVFAVTPRFGPPLSAKTLQVFEKYNVKHLRVSKKLEYDWFPYTNKPRSLVIAEPYITSEFVGYLDADLLILNEPNQFLLNDGEDFAACVTEKLFVNRYEASVQQERKRAIPKQSILLRESK